MEKDSATPQITLTMKATFCLVQKRRAWIGYTIAMNLNSEQVSGNYFC